MSSPSEDLNKAIPLAGNPPSSVEGVAPGVETGRGFAAESAFRQSEKVVLPSPGGVLPKGIVVNMQTLTEGGGVHEGHRRSVNLVVPPDLFVTAAAILTNAWRAALKLRDAGTGEPRDEGARKVYRHVDAIIQSMNHLGFELDDPTGKPYDSGLPLKVISFEPQAALLEETIIETMRPAIRLQGTLIQVGEIIVGIPA